MADKYNKPTIGGQKDKLRVIIVGGSIAGLTLAHCLHINNIDFVLLEGHEAIGPPLGAAIVLLPNGARILDQLGIADDLFAIWEPLQTGTTWNADGKVVSTGDGPKLLKMR